MNGHVVVGVGNIYASESCFMAGIRPTATCKRITKKQCERLVSCIKDVLTRAIDAGGTTLQDFTSTEGKPGYFRHELQVYAREGERCFRCSETIKKIVQAQRSSFYCPACQCWESI